MSAAIATRSQPECSPARAPQWWHDGLTGDLFESGELARLIAGGVQGVCAKPANLYNAIRTGPAYQAVLPALRVAHQGPQDRLDALLLPDVRRACDLLAATYEGSAGRSGFVCAGLSPFLADDRAATVAAAARLHTAVGRPNLLVNVPATQEGVAAIEELALAGIGVNATLVFTPRQAAAVRAAFRRGLARRMESRQSVQRIACVMSMPLTQLDAAVDAQLCPSAPQLRGAAGAASARLAWRAIGEDSGFAIFAAFGAMAPQLALLDAERPPILPGAAYAAQPDADSCGQTDTDSALATVAQLARHGIDLETIGNDALSAALTQLRQTQRNLLALMG